MKLANIWRIKIPEGRRFTRRQNNFLVYSRLDYWLITNLKSEYLTLYSIWPQLIKWQLWIWIQEKRGPGMWKFSCSLLEDQECINIAKVKNIIETNKEEERVRIIDNGLAWDFVKCISEEKPLYNLYNRKRALEREIILRSKTWHYNTNPKDRYRSNRY